MTKKPTTVETTAEQFAEFCESVKYYVDLLHLGEWRVMCFHGKWDTGEPVAANAFAEMCTIPTGRVSHMVLCAEYNQTFKQIFDPWEQGKHEVCELLLTDLRSAARERFTESDVLEWNHAVIRRLERALPGKPETIDVDGQG